MTRREADTLAEIAAALGSIEGRSLLDVGCGHGRLAAALVKRGAEVSAIDPEETAVAAARKAAPEARIEQVGAEALPFGEASFDGVIALNSLHHVPGQHLAATLAGMARVARPGAPILVIEPLAEGSFFEAMRPIEDETEIRAAAQAAIGEACAPGGPLRLVAVDEFERVERFRSVDEFIERVVSVDPARRAAVPAARPAVEELFGRLAEPSASGLSLRQPLRMHRLTKA